MQRERDRPGHRADELRSGLRRSDVGAGLIGTIGGVTVFLAFLLFAVQLLVGLYATTTVTAVAHDTAQRAAGRNAARHPAALDGYVADARRALGGMGSRTTFDWSESIDSDGDGELDVIVLRVVARPPRFVPPALGNEVGLGQVERRIRVAVERFQET